MNCLPLQDIAIACALHFPLQLQATHFTESKVKLAKKKRILCAQNYLGWQHSCNVTSFPTRGRARGFVYFQYGNALSIISFTCWITLSTDLKIHINLLKKKKRFREKLMRNIYQGNSFASTKRNYLSNFNPILYKYNCKVKVEH